HWRIFLSPQTRHPEPLRPPNLNMKRSRRQRNKLPTEAVTLEIERLGHDGRGITHIDGKIAFVEGALPGETVSATYTRRRGQFDELKTGEVLVASANRVTPPCAHAEICGGCAMQHMHPST